MEPHIHFELHVERGVDPIAGWVGAEPGERLRFSGYLEFITLIERLLAPAEPEDTEVAS